MVQDLSNEVPLINEDNLEALEKEAEDENDTAWKPKEEELEQQHNTITDDEATEALNRLLAKAEKYTQFLNRKLMVAGEQIAQISDPTVEEETPALVPEGAPSKKRRVAKSEKPAAEPDLSQYHPKLMTGGTLRPYQIKGFQWMVGLYENGLHGILADEMGLGKTVQTIALIAHLWEMGVYGPFLIVVPLSTVPNWMAELNRWAPAVPALLYHGTKEERANKRAKFLKPANRARDLSKFPVTITTYEIVSRDRSSLVSCKWKHVIVDEGHRLKNFKCRLFRDLNELCGGSVLRGGANKILLTGTPLQNNLRELWSLLNFLMPEIFDNLDFFESVFAFGSTSGGEGEDEDIGLHRQRDIVSKLHQILAPFMMRRLKTEVEKSMPEKKEVVVYVALTEMQREMYRSIVNGELAKLLTAATGSKSKLNNVFMQLRKCALHPYLHFEPKDGFGNHVTNQSIIDVSGKLQLVDKMLKGLKKRGHKVLIFSQFTSLLDIVQDYLDVLRPEWKYARIDGNSKLEERQSQMKDFNEDPEFFVFLLSTRAGGVGINLMAADTVIIFDSDWNPHQDSQAQDRAHRIGQKRDVMVYRLVSSKTVELRILELANSKRKLERVVCAKNATINHAKRKLGVEELQALLQDDFSGHTQEVGDIDDENLEKILDRSNVLKGEIPSKGTGYEVVEHKASSIVGAVNK